MERRIGTCQAMWHVWSSVKTWQGHQIVWPLYGDVYRRPFLSAQQRVVIRRSVFLDRRHIRDGQHEVCELSLEELRILTDFLMVWHCISQPRAQHGEWRVKQGLVSWWAWSNFGSNDCRVPSPGRETNWMLMPEVVADFAMKNFPHMEEDEAFTSPLKGHYGRWARRFQ